MTISVALFPPENEKLIDKYCFERKNGNIGSIEIKC